MREKEEVLKRERKKTKEKAIHGEEIPNVGNRNCFVNAN